MNNTVISTIDEATRDIVVNIESNGTSPWVTFSITLLSGVIVFILGQILFTLWITPLQKYRELKQRIAYQLTYQACYYMNPIIPSRENENYNRASIEIREVASELRGFIETVPKFHLGIPNKSKLNEASKDLMGLSNSVFAHRQNQDITIEQNEKRRKSIRKALNIADSEE